MIMHDWFLGFGISTLLLVTTLAASLYETKQAEEKTLPKIEWPGGKQAAISLSFDDARISQVDAGIPLLDRHSVKATFYVTPSNLRERLEGWKRAVANGHEIGNHSLNHPCTGNFVWSRHKALEDFTLERMRQELEDANRSIQDMLGVVPRTFAYPCGQKFVGRGRNLQSYVPLVAELFSVGRGWMDEGPNDPLFCDMAQALGVPGDNLEFEQIKPMIDRALENGHWLILAGHDIGQADKPQTTQIAMLEALCRYARDPAHPIWIDTVHAVAVYIENAARQ